ncbi:hypothetical protein H6P81_003286 [Aristolochia fimbriata]|uniref:3-ketoacyl-CoA synthase n=1 Tax=Aristolochia fimbriata TaxID=158543 RepID=A0AAV7FGJ5_ARIFI|nr:hypothetical protein H6P81_003286 [Aristolochia fimbriata]
MKMMTMMRSTLTILLRSSFACLLIAFNILLRFLLIIWTAGSTTWLSSSSSSSGIVIINYILDLLTSNRAVSFSLAWCIALSISLYLSRRPRPVLLLDYACFKPELERKCSYEVCEYLVRRSRRFSTASEEFMRGIYLKSGLGDETYVPPFIFQTDYEAKHRSAVEEAEEGMFSAIDALLEKTQVDPSRIDIVIATCGMFSPTPSLASTILNHYGGFRSDVQTFNLSGMGCSAGVVAIDTAAKLLNGSIRASVGAPKKYALVVVTESISLNWYFGENRSMLVTNCIFRVGTAAALLTNDPSKRSTAKMELRTSLRTHHGADDASYRAAFQEEDAEGNTGIALTKDLVRVAAQGLRDHIRILAPRVLPFSQLLAYAYHSIFAVATATVASPSPSDSSSIWVPDFGTAFRHMCIHTGGKAVIHQVGKVLRLTDEYTEPARMTLHRFGNTSSSLVFYQLAYFEAKGRLKKGDTLWMLAFGTGFKVCSLVWTPLRDSRSEPDNPWNDCIHRYPLKSKT